MDDWIDLMVLNKIFIPTFLIDIKIKGFLYIIYGTFQGLFLEKFTFSYILIAIEMALGIMVNLYAFPCTIVHFVLKKCKKRFKTQSKLWLNVSFD